MDRYPAECSTFVVSMGFAKCFEYMGADLILAVQVRESMCPCLGQRRGHSVARSAKPEPGQENFLLLSPNDR